ncbi:MAG: tetratricopeptide repeat protein [Candidatus Thermoplasmatota archaeon]|nr:tetratricopeptide repeat protein [Candidatus Thermoplasmatota archaeon]
MNDGKRTDKKNNTQRLYDTSKCQVKFRKPRILQRRDRNFDHNRDLNFNPNRMIDVRLQGVMFRTESAVGFRNIGINNIEDVMDRKDWPEVGPASSPETMSIQRDHDWEQTWGRDESFEKKWGGPARTQSRDYLYSQDRIKPQLTYYSQKEQVPKERSFRRTRSQNVHDAGRSPRPGSSPTSQSVKGTGAEVSSQPIYAPPSTIDARSSVRHRNVNPNDRKRAFAFNEYALALMESGKYESAMNYFQKALDLDPSEQTYSINMARCREWLEYKKRGGRI